MTTTSDLEGLSEGKVLQSVALTQAEAAALNASGLVEATPLGDGNWRIRASHVVGALRVGDHVLRVRPKIGAVQVLRLLARAHGLRLLSFDEAPLPFDTEPDLHAALAVLFADEAMKAFAAGVVRGYRTEEQSLPVVRGRLRLRDQELRRFGQLTPIEVTVDEWTADTDDNRRIRAANDVLLHLPGVPNAVRGRLGHVDRLLADARLPAAGEPLPSWRATRLNTRLHSLLGLTDLVLEQQVFEHAAGGVHARGFVVRMEKLFEDLVLRLLTELDDDIRVHGQRTYKLDTLQRVTIKPDLVLRRGGTDVAVADTKYKFLDDTGRFSNADAYQLITYCARLGLREGHLIYAAGPLPVAPFEIPAAGVRLLVHKIDLTRTVSQIEQQVRRLRTALVGVPVAPS